MVAGAAAGTPFASSSPWQGVRRPPRRWLVLAFVTSLASAARPRRRTTIKARVPREPGPANTPLLQRRYRGHAPDERRLHPSRGHPRDRRTEARATLHNKVARCAAARGRGRHSPPGRVGGLDFQRMSVPWPTRGAPVRGWLLGPRIRGPKHFRASAPPWPPGLTAPHSCLPAAVCGPAYSEPSPARPPAGSGHGRVSPAGHGASGPCRRRRRRLRAQKATSQPRRASHVGCGDSST